MKLNELMKVVPNEQKVIIYNIFRQKAHGFNRGMNATCM